MVGSTECALIWREKTTPAGRSISRLAPWTPRTSAAGSTGAPWPTVRASTGGPDFASETRPGTGADSLPTVIAKAQWPTAKASDFRPGHISRADDPRRSNLNDKMMGAHWNTPQAMDGNKGSLGPRPHDTGVNLPQQVAASMGQWPTPTLADVQGGRKTRSGARSGEMLMNGLLAAQWSTPRASDGEKGGPNQSFGAGGQPLPSQTQPAPWATPSVVDATGRGYQMAQGKKFLSLPGQMDERLSAPKAATDQPGPEPSGSPSTTAKRGAPNPDFAFWLMGWPAEFRLGVLRAIASLPSSRRKSSARSSTPKLPSIFD